jgi:tRNA pseudouridine32 synthase/23S rRNA pseudouridine746 synthase
MSQRLQKQIQLSQPQLAIDSLAGEFSFSRQKLKQLMQNGAVWLENAQGIHRLRRAKKMLQSGDCLHVYYDEAIQQAQPLPAQLIADEGDYSVWNKPSGMYSQGTRWGDHCSIYRYAESHLQPQRPAFIVHRLDRAASGLILLAHSKQAAAALSRLFEQHAIYKKYTATVEGDFSHRSLPYFIEAPIDDKSALTEVLAVRYDQSSDSSQLEVRIHTGRKHQIRCHLSGLGFPIVGDRLYGSTRLQGDLQLRSVQIKFISPLDGEEKNYVLRETKAA